MTVTPFEPIQHENLTDRVYRAIKDRILSQEIEVGSRLYDDELAAQLRVSRTPVREAIMRLSREGLVDIIPRSGTRVRTFSEQDIEQIFDLRMALEALAARKATPRIPQGQIASLKRLHARAEAALKAGDTTVSLEFDRKMHDMILEWSGNSRLQDMMATINDFVALFRNLGARTPFHRGYTARHREIMRALERRQPEAAAAALVEHIEVARKELFCDFERRKLLTSGTETARAPNARPRRSRAVTPQNGAGSSPAEPD
jgi:DNA-binding GntR family transcriptional regulator